MQKENRGAVAAFSLSQRELANAAYAEALITVATATLQPKWPLLQRAGSVAGKVFWVVIDFWNIPVLGPSDPQR